MLEIPPTPPANFASCPGLNIGAGQPGCAPYWELALLSYCSQLSGQNCAYCVLGLPGPARLPCGSQDELWYGHDKEDKNCVQRGRQARRVGVKLADN
ncbi:hypothetical protein DSO57_1016753 [Entomophthora muscae]|uniref:Uncharacterized protein n=1 Tax=Entomophthora muscae TaxID=34485 RepID=A0ACC2TS48_9FUNG|nr:hypothetical protein DSO57_1016753 [Entomophthora muscae]